MLIRLDSMNEFRMSLKDQQAKFPTRDEFWAVISPIKDALAALQKLANIAEGKASKNVVLGAYVLAIINLIALLVKAFIK
jgi:hypothetical protein